MAALAMSGPAVTAETRRGGVEQLERLAAEWLLLWRHARNPEPFYRPEWIVSYLRAFEPGAHVLLLAAYVDMRLCAVLPLVERMRTAAGVTFRTLHGAANVHSCRFDILCAQGAEGDAGIAAIWDLLGRLPGWDALEIPAVPGGGAAERLLRLAAADGFKSRGWPSMQSPYMAVPASAVADPLRLISSAKSRANIRRRSRNASRLGEVRLRRAHTFDENDLRVFMELEKRGWKGGADTAIACHPATLKFYRDVATQAASGGYLSLYFLEIGQVPVAAHFGLTSGTHYYIPKVAYDEGYAEFGPGHLLLSLVLQDLASRGITTFDFLGPAMPWKAMWTDSVRPHTSLYVYPPRAFGQVLHFVRFRLGWAARKALHSPGVAKLRHSLSAVPRRRAGAAPPVVK